MATSGSRGTRYYKAQSKFVHRDHPFGDDARFRPGLPSLQDILDALNKRYAKDGFDNLLNLNVDQEEIGHLLRMIGASSDEPIDWPRGKRRVANQLSSKCRKLAEEIEHPTQNWPFGTRMMYSDYIEWMDLPRVLRSYAKAWKEQLEHPYRSARTPRNENILHLLEYVKDKTGAYHYKEVAELLNATDAAYGWECRDGNDRWSADNLKGIKFGGKKKSK